MPFADREAQREYQRKWIADRRREWLKENGPCVDCGSWDDLEVHHRDPSQKVTHRIWSYRKKRRDAELKKCAVTCKGCHKKKTAEHRKSSRNVIHATVTAYSNGCRCEMCCMAFSGARKSYPSRQSRKILKRRGKIK